MDKQKELQVLLKAADDLMVEAQCVCTNPSEINIKALREVTQEYLGARSDYRLFGLDERAETSKPGPTLSSN